MADRVDAPVNAMQLSSLDSIANRSRTQTSAFELVSSDDPMLLCGYRRRNGIGHVAFLTHVGT